MALLASVVDTGGNGKLSRSEAARATIRGRSRRRTMYRVALQHRDRGGFDRSSGRSRAQRGARGSRPRSELSEASSLVARPAAATVGASRDARIAGAGFPRAAGPTPEDGIAAPAIGALSALSEEKKRRAGQRNWPTKLPL